METTGSHLRYIQTSLSRYLKPGIVPYISLYERVVEDGREMVSPVEFSGVLRLLDDSEMDEPRITVVGVTEVLAAENPDDDVVLGEHDLMIFALSQLSIVVLRFHNPNYRRD